MRVALVGDWPLVRSGFRQVLQSAGIGVIASVADAADALTALRRVGADVVVVSALTCQAGVSNTRSDDYIGFPDSEYCGNKKSDRNFYPEKCG